ncbi:MAG TPA: dynamin family protein [Thiothrix sp.]|nr:dynamin family protein [Thiothrix sp.]
MTPEQRMQNRLKRLQQQLKREHPILVEVVNQYKELDKIAQRMGLLAQGESYATQISWWPLVSVLGTFSAGKSSFINTYLGIDNLQQTGNQAVDDRFTVLTFSPDATQRTLPGLALDGDPRFPFYQMSEEIEHVVKGEGAKIDKYLQMKATPSEKLRGKILIDSPGFDADEQRKSTLKITDHIIGLSDLVLVFFDARHPEPGAMQDTLEHLVQGSQRRNDASKFVFILNQIDSSAREDNLEEVVASWQKALVQNGVTSGAFYVLFNDRLAVPVPDENVWARYVAKRNADYQRITERIDSISVERSYRIIGAMESLTNQIEQQAVPKLRQALQTWQRRVLIADGVILAAMLGIFLSVSINQGYWQGLLFAPPWGETVANSLPLLIVVLAIPTVIFLSLHFTIRKYLARFGAKKLSKDDSYGNLSAAFMKRTQFYRSVFGKNPAGWNKRMMQRLDGIRDAADRFVQKLNDRFTNPSGSKSAATPPAQKKA